MIALVVSLVASLAAVLMAAYAVIVSKTIVRTDKPKTLMDLEDKYGSLERELRLVRCASQELSESHALELEEIRNEMDLLRDEQEAKLDSIHTRIHSLRLRMQLSMQQSNMASQAAETAFEAMRATGRPRRVEAPSESKAE